MKTIRQPDHPAAYQVVIMMSGHQKRGRVERALKFGVNGYLTKPLSPRRLYMQIVQVSLNPKPFVKQGSYFGPDHWGLRDKQKVHRPSQDQTGQDFSIADLDDTAIL